MKTQKSNGVISPEALQTEAPEFSKFIQTLFPFKDVKKYAIISASFYETKFDKFKGHIYQCKFYSGDMVFLIAYIDGSQRIDELDEDGYTTGKHAMYQNDPTIWFESYYRTALPGEKEKRDKFSWNSNWSDDSKLRVTQLVVSSNLKQLKAQTDIEDDGYYPIYILIKQADEFEKFLIDYFKDRGGSVDEWLFGPKWRVSNEDTETRVVSVAFEIRFGKTHVNSFNLGAAWVEWQNNISKQAYTKVMPD